VRGGILLVTFFQFLIAPSLVCGADHPLRRWAILASAELRQAGLSDLLTAELSKSPGIELVEREQLAAATKELDLSALLGSANAAGRLRLGRLLKADALLLLSLERAGKTALLHIVISDCRYGARLSVLDLPYSPALSADALRKIVRVAELVRSQFNGGIRQVIGVTHFVSKSLTHDDDHLQAGFARLIESELMRQPGVAVIEIEEARTIAQELAVTGGNLEGRVTPLIIEGEYEKESKVVGQAAEIRLAVRLSAAGRNTEELRRDRLSLREAIALLTREVPQKVAQAITLPETTPLLDAEQAKLLEGRAAEFSKLGAYEHSIELREAVLLLTPDDLGVRLDLLANYHGWDDSLRNAEGTAAFGLRKEPPSLAAAVRSRQLERVRAMVRHVEHVVHSGTLSQSEAESLVRAVFQATRFRQIMPPLLQTPEMRELLDQFFWEIYPALSKLECKRTPQHLWERILLAANNGQQCFSSNKEKQYFYWSSGACYYLAYNAVRGKHAEVFPFEGATGSWLGEIIGVKGAVYFDDARTLDDLYRFLTEVASPEMPPIPYMAYIVARPPKDAVLVNQGRFSEQQWRAFYARLRQTNQTTNVYYARCGLLMLDTEAQKEPKQLKALLAEAESLLTFMEVHGGNRANAPYDNYPDDTFFQCITKVRDSLKRLMRGDLSAGQGYRPPPWVLPFENLDVPRQLKFDPVGQIAPSWKELRKCTATMDVLRSEKQVAVMREKGVVQTILSADKEDLGDLVFDGENFWVAASKSGVFIVSPAGQTLATIGAAEGLPKYFLPVSWGMRLHALEPGRCLALGAVGPERRVWMAVIERQGDELGRKTYRVNVFHKAIELPKLYQSPPQSLQTIFYVDCCWTAWYAPPDRPDRPLVLIGRSSGDALLLDPKTLQISTLPMYAPRRGQYVQAAMFVGGRVLHLGQGGWPNICSPDQKTGRWTNRPLLRSEVFEAETILADGPVLYLPGKRVWHRVDAKTLECDRLNDVPLPRPFWFLHFAVSAHYGVVAWGLEEDAFRSPAPKSEPLYHVTAAEHVSPADNPNIPLVAREKHQQAVDALRKLGAVIDASNQTPESGTKVRLDARWKGGDADLALLDCLYNLRSLEISFAKIGNEGMRHLAPLQDLRKLSLWATGATDEGLVHLESLPDLTHLSLQSRPTGIDFTDAGLVHLKNSAKLQRLILFGKGFTHAGLKHLKDLHDLEVVEALFTSISEDQLQPDQFPKVWLQK
jgi:hypothetical protein